MDIKVPVSTMQDIVNRMSTIVKMNTEDATGMILIEATDEGRVYVSGTNISTSIVMTAEDCVVDVKGKILVRLGDIKSYLNKFSQLSEGYGTEYFRFLVKGDTGQLKTKTHFESGKPAHRNLKLTLFSTSMFPTIKSCTEANLIINSDILKEGLSKVLHCIDPGNIRQAMAGAYIMIDNDKMTFVGTNGVKLSESMLTINGDIQGKDVVLRYDFANAMKIVLDPNSQVFMRLEDRTAYVSCNNVYIVGTLVVNEEYPDYKAVLAAYDKVITVPKYDFTDSVMSVLDVLDPEDNSRLSIHLKDSELHLWNDRVDVTHEFDAPFAHELDIDLNGAFLFSLLNDMSGEYLDICFMEGRKTIIFKPHGRNGHTSLLSTVRRR